MTGGTMTRTGLLLALALLALGLTETARGDINVGVTLSATGAAASLGIPERNTFELLPTTIGGQKVKWIVLDDGPDTTQTGTDRRKPPGSRSSPRKNTIATTHR